MSRKPYSYLKDHEYTEIDEEICANWRNESSYPKNDDPDEIWMWEFLRRNHKYQKDWLEATKKETLTNYDSEEFANNFVPGKLSNQISSNTITTSSPNIWLAHKWGIALDKIPPSLDKLNPVNKNTSGFRVQPPQILTQIFSHHKKIAESNSSKKYSNRKQFAKVITIYDKEGKPVEELDKKTKYDYINIDSYELLVGLDARVLSSQGWEEKLIYEIKKAIKVNLDDLKENKLKRFSDPDGRTNPRKNWQTNLRLYDGAILRTPHKELYDLVVNGTNPNTSDHIQKQVFGYKKKNGEFSEGIIRLIKNPHLVSLEIE